MNRLLRRKGKKSMKKMLLAFTIIFLGCSLDDSSTMPEQVYLEDGITPYTGNGILKSAQAVNGRGSIDGYIDMGTIVDGKITLELPSSVPEKYLSKILENAPGTVTITPSGGKWLNVMGLSVFEGEEEKGSVGQRTSNDSVTITDSIAYRYFTQAVSISGTYLRTDFPAGHPLVLQNYQINARAGWNKIYSRTTQKPPSEQGALPEYEITYKTDLSGAPSDMKWIFYEPTVFP
jgi:hypothetical protein